MQIKNYLLWFRVQGDLRIDEYIYIERERDKKKRIFEISNENSDKGFAYRFKSKGEVEAF